MNNYLKIPTEMATFALRQRKYREVCTYTASQFVYSGKAKLSDRPARRIGDEIGLSESSVYRHFKWLLGRDWMGKDRKNGWLFFRGLDRVHEIENWQYARAAIMYKKDLQNCKAFLAGVVCASLVETGKNQRTEPTMGGSLPTVGLISLSSLAYTLDVSTKTAYRLRKLAAKCNYINNRSNLIPITNLTPNQLTELRKQDFNQIRVELLGYSDKKIVPVDRIRYKNEKLKLQGSNKIERLIQLKSRKGLSKMAAPNPKYNVGQK